MHSFVHSYNIWPHKDCGSAARQRSLTPSWIQRPCQSTLAFTTTTTTTCTPTLTYLTPITYVAQPSLKPLHGAALCGHKLCLAHLLLAAPAMLQLKTRGCSAADYARQYDEPEVVAALEKWAAGDKAGALRELGAADLISSLPPSSSSAAAAAAVTDKASSSQMVQVQVSLWSWLLL